MKKICKASGRSFKILPADQLFYDRVGMPPPTLCPEERQRRRLAWRNERTLYKRTCSGSGRTIIATYPPDAPFPVFDHSYFFSDQWAPSAFGQEFDFSRPFFEQYAELQQRVPRLLNYSLANENAEYGNLASWNRDCFMLFEADNNRGCLYAEYSYRCVDVVDCSYATECELCYICIDVLRCFNLFYSLNCTNCHDGWFLKNCIGCSNCFACVNLRNKQYWMWNKPVGRTEYEARLMAMSLSRRDAIAKLWQEFLSFCRRFPVKFMHGEQNEEVTGDYLHNCKSAYYCFDSANLRDCKFVCNTERTTSAYDIDSYGGLEGAELVYECHSVGRGAFNVAFGNNVYRDAADCLYCDGCAHVRDLFGCISMHHARNCILNKQYDEDDFRKLKERIIDHMMRTGEWGEFFPIRLSPFAYNETMAEHYYPLSKEQALGAGYRWRDADLKDYLPQQKSLPDSISECDASVCDSILSCAKTAKNYRIQNSELMFYRTNNLPLPDRCPDERFRERMALRNPRRLFQRSCAASGREIWTTFAPHCPEVVLCEDEYLKAVL